MQSLEFTTTNRFNKMQKSFNRIGISKLNVKKNET